MRGCGITTTLKSDATLRRCTTKVYDRRDDELTLR
jgi:hypothetical protein